MPTGSECYDTQMEACMTARGKMTRGRAKAPSLAQTAPTSNASGVATCPTAAAPSSTPAVQRRTGQASSSSPTSVSMMENGVMAAAPAVGSSRTLMGTATRVPGSRTPSMGRALSSTSTDSATSANGGATRYVPVEAAGTSEAGSTASVCFSLMQAHGVGTFTYDDGEHYAGDWAFGKKHGVGTLTYADGSTYTGLWDSDRVCHGTMRFANGDIYEGGWLRDRRSGTGTLTRAADGSRYEGEWRNGKQHGTGTLHLADGQCITGTWTRGRRDLESTEQAAAAASNGEHSERDDDSDSEASERRRPSSRASETSSSGSGTID
jgi:hypothetical protein